MSYPSEDGYDRAAAELADRRQRARMAGLDAYSGVLAVPSAPERAAQAVDDAIETATRVRITPEIYNAAVAAQSAPNPQGLRGAIKAAFEAAGFEVEQ